MEQEDGINVTFHNEKGVEGFTIEGIQTDATLSFTKQDGEITLTHVYEGHQTDFHFPEGKLGDFLLSFVGLKKEEKDSPSKVRSMPLSKAPEDMGYEMYTDRGF